MAESPLTFDQARRRALELDRSSGSQLGSLRIWVRDLFGRITLYADGFPPTDERRFEEASQLVATTLGVYATRSPVVRMEDTLLRPLLVNAGVREPIADDGSSFFLERYVMGSEWLGGPLPNRAPTPPRAVLYGLKGGVGRSTALAVWARHLAEVHGKKVLVVDLDLEAPGVSSILLGHNDRPRSGIVDWFVESSVGRGDRVLSDMVATSPLGRGLEGSIHVAPAAGFDDGSYLRKLNRVYVDLPSPTGPVTFATRLATMVDDLEATVNPDVVLLDSRAGLHDIAAVALTRLQALTFLFAVNTSQTWDGYGYLFDHWQVLSALNRDAFRDLRERLRLVAGQIPELNQSEYFKRIRANAYNLFLKLYDEAGPEDVDAVNFDIDAEDAPHHPLRIHWNRAFQEYDPQGEPDAVTPEQLHAAFGGFLERASALLLPEEDV
jgi:CobQ/CobB/MinD/ParA nucleotide binding domain